MASNYWESTQYKHWTFENVDLCPGPAADLQRVSKEELTLIHMYFALLLMRVGKKLSIRQKHISTAIMFFKRFYTKNSFATTEPFLVATTAMYLAGKVDEYPYHITNVLSETTSVLKDGDPSIKLPYDTADLAEFEFYMLETLHGRIAVYHPYHPFSTYVETLALDSAVQQTGWQIINDTFLTSLNLTYPPHMIALAAVFLSLVALKDDLAIGSSSSKSRARASASNNNQSMNSLEKLAPKDWFSGLNVDLEEIAVIAQAILDSYQIYKSKYSANTALNLLKSLQGTSSPSSGGLSSTPHLQLHH